MTRGARPLMDHVTTLNAYLNNYKEKDVKSQDEISQSSNSYLLSTCWEKVARRIASLQSLGFIRFLTILPVYGLEYNKNETNLWVKVILTFAALQISLFPVVST